jgi:hypothetical protein
VRVVLEIASGPLKRRTITLCAGQRVVIGRAKGSDYTVPDDQHISRRHFAVEFDGRACQIYDLNSANGTMLNGTRVAEAVVRDGDEIMAGQTKFAVHIETDAAVDVPSQPFERPFHVRETLAPPVAATTLKSFSISPVQSRPTLPLEISEAYEKALKDEDPAVRWEAISAAAWTGEKWLLEYCRKLADRPKPEHWEAILLLAILGDSSDLRSIRDAGKASELGPRRFKAFGAFGHPGVIELLLEGIEDEDPLVAVAAGTAFSKITGADIESDNRVQVLPEDASEPDEFEREFLEEVTLPRPALAKAQWEKVKDNFSQGTRWCRGFDLSHGCSGEVLSQLDMESRWEACLRGNYEGTWHGSLIDLEIFPQDARWEKTTNR